MKTVSITDGVSFGDGGLGLIAGPCVIEGRDHCLRMATLIHEVVDGLDVGWVFKASYDKANRTSRDSFRGPGPEEGLEILAEVREQFGVPVLTDVHDVGQVAAAAAVVDVLQIPAFLARQTDLLVAAANRVGGGQALAFFAAADAGVEELVEGDGVILAGLQGG